MVSRRNNNERGGVQGEVERNLEAAEENYFLNPNHVSRMNYRFDPKDLSFERYQQLLKEWYWEEAEGDGTSHGANMLS